MRLQANAEATSASGCVFARPRVTAALSFASGERIVVLVAPAGSGKSAAVAAACPQPHWVHYRAGRCGRTFARFVRGFAKSVYHLAPGALISFPRAWERALQSEVPEKTLAHWLCEHLHGIAADVVLDDLHAATSDASIAAFIAHFAQLRSGDRLVICARTAGLLPLPLWMANAVMSRPLDGKMLRFTAEEIGDFARMIGAPAVDARRLSAATDGYPAAVAHFLMLRSAGADLAGLAPVRSFAALCDRMFEQRDSREQQFLMSSALLPEYRGDLIEAAGWQDWRGLHARIDAAAPFLWERDASGQPRFFDRVAEYLGAKLREQEPALRTPLVQRAVGALHTAGRHDHALRVAVEQELVEDICGLLDEHGFDILESGHVDDVAEAFTVIDASDVVPTAGITALRGYVDARLGRHDTSESWFQHGGAQAVSEECRVKIALYYARELMRQLREDAFEVLEPYAQSTTLSHHTLVDVRSALAQAYVVADRFELGRERMAEALAMLDATTPTALRARVFSRAAYVAFESGDAEAARTYASQAAPLAIAEGLFDVATSVYTVLYTVAYEIDDDPAACLDHLASVREYGMKSGTMRLDLYALVAMYELYTEAGDLLRLTELDRAIDATDVKAATVSFHDSFLPARAMQAGWVGDFAYAKEMLTPTADRQPTRLRQALRWSEVMLYAAACADRTAAADAGSHVESCLGHAASSTTHEAFAALNCALASWVLGDLAAAAAWVDTADRCRLRTAKRVQAYRSTVDSLIGAAREPSLFPRRLADELAGLTATGYGGIALVIRALPIPAPLQMSPSSTATTIGAQLVRARLDELFRAAVLAPAAEAELFAWVRETRAHPLHARATAEVIAGWPEAGVVHAGRSARLARCVRAEIGPRGALAVPAFVRREIGVDASIDAVFADLQHTAPLMAEHSQAVSAWCSRIARRLGLDDDAVAYVARCGLLHDIGKTRTPASILNAPRRLTPQEWDIMQHHAVEGAELASRVPALHPFVPIIRGHHERLDGKGYPDGLHGHAIPLAARIVTVADCFNAMIGRRAYRLPLSPTNALDELDRNRYTQFDPDVVDAMIGIVSASVATDRSAADSTTAMFERKVS